MRGDSVLLFILVMVTSCNHSSGRRQTFAEEQVVTKTSITIIGQPHQEECDGKLPRLNTDSALTLYQPAPSSHVSEQIVNKKAFIVSYNKDTKMPNWVAWHLTAEHTDGLYRRMAKFHEDEDAPPPRATNEDYKRSSWSRGHMCPAGDNKWDENAMYETFSLVNVCPQEAKLNSGLWNRIEQDCRSWARKFGDIYIVCGPVLLRREHETIGQNKVVVPEAFFKVILCLQDKPKAIGFVVKNNAGAKKKDQYVNTVDEVERITGYDFFPALPDSVEEKVEAYSNINDWR